MSKKMILGVIAIVVVALLGWYFFANKSEERGTQETVKIGVILPMTGELASYGISMKSAIQIAYNELDSSKYELIYIDSKANNADAVSGLNKLIFTNGVKYVIGDVSSSTTMAMVKIAEQNQVFLLSPGAVTPELRNISKFFARDYPSTDEESVSAAKFIFDNFTKENVAIVHSNDEYGLGLSSVFKKEFGRLGGKISEVENYEAGARNFRAILDKIRSLNPKLIYLAGNQKEMGIFMKQYQQLGLHIQIVSDISFLEDDCLQVAGSAAEGVIVPVAYYNPSDTTYKVAFQFGKSFETKFGKQPTVVDAIGYDALKLMVQAIEKTTNSLEAATYIRNLKNYDGALGVLNFTDGDVSMPIVFKTIKGGTVVDYK
jgi:branched-chain amino acid transport system substrate-binding protein